eukprot:jgi/Chrzof1/2557/Cz11g20080.t1
MCADGPDEFEGSKQDLSKVAEQLNRLMLKQRMTGSQLRQLLFSKWGRTFEARLHRRGNRMYFQVMWKFLEQRSFHMTEEEYMRQLDAVADLLSDWGVADRVTAAIQADKSRGPGYTQGGGARCVSIPLNVDLSGSRRNEWRS